MSASDCYCLPSLPPSVPQGCRGDSVDWEWQGARRGGLFATATLPARGPGRASPWRVVSGGMDISPSPSFPEARLVTAKLRKGRPGMRMQNKTGPQSLGASRLAS